jgi:hypothetical protein
MAADLRGQYAEAIRTGLREWAAMDIEGTRGVTKWDFLAIGVVAVRDDEVQQLQDDVRMHMNVRLEVEKILDVALGPNEEDGAGGGLAADVALVADRLKRMQAELEQLKRGGKELGKSIVVLTGLIKDAYLRGADDPIDALQMLGNFLAEVFEDEGGLSPDDFNRVYRALEDRRKTESEIERLREENARWRQQANASKVSEDILQANINALVAERDV